MFSPDGTRLALSGDDGINLSVCDVENRKTLPTLPLHGEFVFCLLFSRDARKIVAGCASGVVKIWDLADQSNEITLTGHTRQVRGLALLPDGRTLVSAAGEIRVRDLISRQEIFSLKPRATSFYGCSISQDGERLATGAETGLITIWDLASRQEVATLHGHDRLVDQVAFLPDGNSLLSVGLDQVRVWHAASFEEADREVLKK